MPKLQLDKGRIIQKLKTRELLLIKANELLKRGLLTSIEQVGSEAGISKATAYRYFTNLETLKREASLQLKAEEPDDLFTDLSPYNLNGRLERLINYHFQLFTNNEEEFRLFLSSVINESVANPGANLRGGRRIALITAALISLKGNVSDSELSNMTNALSLVFGIESITILKDLCKLDNQGVLESWKWTVNRIVFGSDR